MSNIIVETTPLKDVLVLKPKSFKDDRGYFYESWRQQDYKDAGIPIDFLQDNCSYSKKGVLRGLHIQKSQGQILWPTYGRVMQVIVDVRPKSETFGKTFSIIIDHETPQQLYMPPGFAGGFCVLSDVVCMNYKCSEYYSPTDEGGILWNDPDLNIQWPEKDPIVSARDQKFPRFKDINPTDFL